MKRLLIVACLAAVSPMLAACPAATLPEPKLQTQIVQVPVPVACRPNLGPDPSYPDADEALARVTDIYAGTQLLVAGRKLRIAREGELKAALQGCAGAQ